IRRRRWTDLGVACLGAGGAWLLANLPALATGVQQWKVFWSFNAQRGPDLGSLWLVLQQASGRAITPHTVNLVSEALFALWCLGVLFVGVRAPVTPRFSQIGYLVVVGFLLVNKVYSPQYVLWLLPLAVLAVPRWRDQLIWQAGELLYFVSVWWYLAGLLHSGGGDDAPFYWLSIILRVLAELYLAAVIIKDMYEPAADPVRWTSGEPEDQEPSSISSNEVVV
ncbi:MAG: hypothetical protein J2O46_00950, partial [Nocardioides sp.]|nr:hypothetical protein [Nocardioides sp.]